jgi:hypothetical protein
MRNLLIAILFMGFVANAEVTTFNYGYECGTIRNQDLRAECTDSLLRGVKFTHEFKKEVITNTPANEVAQLGRIAESSETIATVMIINEVITLVAVTLLFLN